MHSDDENVRVCRKGRCEVIFRDLEAGLPIDSAVDEEGMHHVDLCDSIKPSGCVEASDEPLSGEAFGHGATCDVKALVDSHLRGPLLAHVQTDDTKSSQDKDLLSRENKLGGDHLEKEAEFHGHRKRRSTELDSMKLPLTGDSGVGKMPEEERKVVTATRTKEVFTDSCQEVKPRPPEKKPGKQGKGAAKQSTVRRVGEVQPLEELRAKEEAETNRKVHESLDNFIRQTIRCEPYMTLGRPSDKPLQRLRPDVFDNHVTGKFSRGFKVDGRSDPRDMGTEDNMGIDTHSSDADGVKDSSSNVVKGISGLGGRGSQHSLKVPPGVVTGFTQAAAKGSDLQGWLSPSKVTFTKCEKCSREFSSTLNYRRHVRSHRKSLNPEKEDLSKERLKLAAFWDKLTPEEASSVVHHENMEIEELSGQSAFKALLVFLQQPGVPSLPQPILKAGTLLLDLVQNKGSVFPLSSERLLSILDDASEKTFLCGGTSVAVQRFVFNGEAGKVGLEEKNLVASMGFHIELRLVKAWMADKEAEALRCQQALFKEEEAAQQKRAKLLEKKRMKKIRQKERKGSASQLILQELETESVDDDGNMQGTGGEDDSPTATGSSSPSLASAQDLALPESTDIDLIEDVVTHVDDKDELVGSLQRDLAAEKGSLDRAEEDEFSCYGHDEMSRTLGHDSPEVRCREEDLLTKGPALRDLGPDCLLRCPEEDTGNVDARLPLPSFQGRGGRAVELHHSLHFRKGEQERVGSDLKRRELDRSAFERKAVRTMKDRSRNEYPEMLQKYGRDPRGFDARYAEGSSQAAFKPVRKASVYVGKGDTGPSDLLVNSRVHQYRSKTQTMSRAVPMSGSGQVVWTRKVVQSTAMETMKEMKDEGIQDGLISGKITAVEGCEVKEVLPKVAGIVSDFAGDDVATKLDMGRIEKSGDPASPVSADGHRLPGLRGPLIPAEDIPDADEGLLSGALLVGSLSVPLGKFAMVSAPQTRVGTCAPAQLDHSEVATRPGQQHDLTLPREEFSASGTQISVDVPDGPDGFTKCIGSLLRAPGSKALLSATQNVKARPQLLVPNPERGERLIVASPLVYEKLAAKQGLWQGLTAGRYTSAKVWRPVGIVGDRQDLSLPGLQGAVGDSATNFCDRRTVQDDLQISGRSESERDISPKVDDTWQSNDGQFVMGDLSEMPKSTVVNSNFDKIYDQYFSRACESRMSVEPGSELLSDGIVENYVRRVGDDGVDSAVLASSLCSLAVFVEVAETFLNERWRVAVAHASVDEVLIINEGFYEEAEEFNFLDRILQQLANKSPKHQQGAESLLSQSTSVLSGSGVKSIGDGGVFLSRIFSDSDQTGLEDLRCQSGTDEQQLDGAYPQESGIPQAVSSEDDTGMRDASASPVDSEQNMSGSETSRSYTVSGTRIGREVEKQSEGRSGGSSGSSNGRHGNSRQERWFRGPRDRFQEQRYMPRRRAPVEKNS